MTTAFPLVPNFASPIAAPPVFPVGPGHCSSTAEFPRASLAFRVAQFLFRTRRRFQDLSHKFGALTLRSYYPGFSDTLIRFPHNHASCK